MGMTALQNSFVTSGRLPGAQVSRRGLRAQRAVTRPACKAAAQEDTAMGFKMMRKGIKEASADTVVDSALLHHRLRRDGAAVQSRA